MEYHFHSGSLHNGDFVILYKQNVLPNYLYFFMTLLEVMLGKFNKCDLKFQTSLTLLNIYITQFYNKSNRKFSLVSRFHRVVIRRR